ncbi:hypothetical protein Tco_0840977 [Tanacetum coccineum]|uniref:Retrovirus-related Pol polyprotein from transposon TNT 1-94-like beta-barrel domain-containing protein n=1 Tax=Tanacetum coccineum TaxID=301880 RepID=A0ABQ5AV26_9ASTR
MAAAIKHMALNFAKLDKFKWVDFRRWQKKMHFLLSSMSVVYVLTTPMPENGGDNPTIEQNVETSKELWDTLEAKYMTEDASSKKSLVSNFTNYKMTYSRPILEQYNELLGILGKFTQHKMNTDKFIQVSCIIDKLPSLWKDFKHTLKHLKEELTLVELGSHLCIEESLRVHDNNKPKGNNVVGPSVVNMDDDVWWVESGATVHVCKDRCCFKTYESLNDGSILHMRNESTALVHGRGCVDLRFNSGKVVSLLNVLHVPNIRKNLVSSSVLNNYGYKQVLKMISEVVLQALADHKSILYGSRSERFGVKFYVELKYLRIVVLRLIMPPRMMTRSAGRATATPRGGRTGRRTGRGCGRTRGRSGDQGNGRIDGQGGKVGGQGTEVNDAVDRVPDFSTITTTAELTSYYL